MKITDLYNDMYLKHLKNYVANPDAISKVKISQHWDELVKAFPNEKNVLYRGINFLDKDSFEKFMSTMPIYSTDNITSWSKSYNEALTFAKTAPQDLSQMSPDKIDALNRRFDDNDITGYAGIVVSLQIQPSIGIDLEKAAVSLEEEVLLPKGSYRVEYTVVQSNKMKLKNKDTHFIIDTMLTSSETISYLLASRHDEISENDFKRIFTQYWTPPKYSIQSKYNIVTEERDINVYIKYSKLIITNFDRFPTSIQSTIIKDTRRMYRELRNELKTITDELKKKDISYDVFGINQVKGIVNHLGIR